MLYSSTSLSADFQNVRQLIRSYSSYLESETSPENSNSTQAEACYSLGLLVSVINTYSKIEEESSLPLMDIWRNLHSYSVSLCLYPHNRSEYSSEIKAEIYKLAKKVSLTLVQQ